MPVLTGNGSKNALSTVLLNSREATPFDKSRTARFFKIGEYVAAKRNYPQAYEIRLDIFGIDAESTVETAKQLSGLYSLIGENDRSVELARQVFETQARLHGGESELAVDARGRLGVSLLRAKKYKEAKEILIRTIDDARQIGLEE